MKKLILFICAIVLFPMITFAQVIDQKTIDQAIELRTNYTYDWGSFKWDAKQTTDKEGNWKYGYVKAEDDYNYIPNKPKKHKTPDYLSQFPIVNDKDIDEFRSKDRNYIRFVKSIMPGSDEDEIVFGVTENYEWIVVDNRGYYGRFNNKFQPYEDARISIMKTIKMRCEKENRDPTSNEKYLILVLDLCKDELRDLDMQYIASHQKEYESAQKSENFEMWVSGPIKVVLWCLLALFAFVLPGLIVGSIKLIFPKDSVFYKAVCVLEGILGVLIITYWFGNRR